MPAPADRTRGRWTDAPPAGDRGDLSWIRADLHTHTSHSLDAFPAPADLARRAAEVGLDRIAVTDHGSIEGALEARAVDPARVIVGEEVRCACRTEVIGLFLSRRVPDGLSVEETVERIRDQGGVVYVPHPFAYLRAKSERVQKALALADVVEVANARAFLPAWNRQAGRAATSRDLPGGAGSDAHRLSELGRARLHLPAFRNAEGFLDAVRLAEPELLRTTGPEAHLLSVGWKAVRLARDTLPLGRPGRSGGETAPAT